MPFSSARKWSAVSFADVDAPGTWVLGAPEMVFGDAATDTAGEFGRVVTELASTGLGMALYPITFIQAVVKLQRDILATLRETGSTAGFVDAMLPLPQVTALLGAGTHADFENTVLARS